MYRVEVEVGVVREAYRRWCGGAGLGLHLDHQAVEQAVGDAHMELAREPLVAIGRDQREHCLAIVVRCNGPAQLVEPLWPAVQLVL